MIDAKSIVGAYLVLTGISGGLMYAGAEMIGGNELFDVASKTFILTIGAAVGALSSLAAKAK